MSKPRTPRVLPRARILAVVASAAVLLAACGGGNAGQEGAGGAAGGSGGASAAADPDAVLRFQFGTPGGSNYDPATSTNQFVNTFLYPAFDRLIYQTPEGDLEPMLAESYEFSEDNLTFTMTLREGVTFHDGTPFDAAAVVANIQRGQTLENSTLRADLAVVREAVAVDPRTVELRLASTAGSLPALLADRAGMMTSPAAFGNDDLDLMPVGTGPYRVTAHQPGVLVTYERYEDYWDPEAQTLGGIEISIQLDPEARLRALTDGQVDATALNTDQADLVTGDGLTVDSRVSAAAFILYLNKTVPGLDNADVRRALSLAVDRAGISEALQGGRCTPSSQLFPEGYWANSPDVATVAYDPEQARQLLAGAGYATGLTIDAVVINVPFYVAQLEAIQAQLAEVGVTVNVTALEPTELLSRFVGGEADAYFSQWPGATDPAKTVAGLLLAQSTLNPGGYTDPDIDRLAAEGLGAVGEEARAPIYQELSATVAEEEFHVVICNPENVFAFGPGVSGLTSGLTGAFDLTGATVSG
jgi:peptide/nickel transport system substrate-binding protein